MQFKIGKYTLSERHPSFIVAELSGNHGGSLNRAIKLIKSAKKAGANAVKLQTYKADTITFKSKKKDFKINSNSPWSKFNNYWDLYDYAHTPWSWHKKLFKTAKLRSIQLLCGEGTRDVKKITKTKSANANGTKPYLLIIF